MKTKARILLTAVILLPAAAIIIINMHGRGHGLQAMFAACVKSGWEIFAYLIFMLLACGTALMIEEIHSKRKIRKNKR